MRSESDNRTLAVCLGVGWSGGGAGDPRCDTPVTRGRYFNRLSTSTPPPSADTIKVS